MSYKEAFNTRKKQLESFPADKLKTLNIPIKIICAEAEVLSITAHNDKTQLLNAGLNWELVEVLSSLSAALRYCEAEWKGAGQSQTDILWKQKKNEAETLKKELLRHFNYAFYHMDNGLNLFVVNGAENANFSHIFRNAKRVKL